MRARHQQLLARELARLKRRGHSVELFRGAGPAELARGDEFSRWIQTAKASLDQYVPSASRAVGASATRAPSAASLRIARVAEQVREQFAKDRRFLYEKVRRLRRYRRYQGKHVAVFDEKIIASASNADDLIKEVVEKHGWPVLSRSVTEFVGPDRDEA